jgi:hypothetical protein
MSRHHHKARLAALAASVGATFAIAALGSAGTAMAGTLACATPGFGSGATAQDTAQEKLWLTASGWGANTQCAKPYPATSITYTGTSAGAGLNEFGNVTGKLDAAEDPTASKAGSGAILDKAGQPLDWYVGTDDPPTTGELGNAIVASGDKNGNLEEITIPVLQDPVALILSFPVGCLVPSGGLNRVQIDGESLVQIWEGDNPANPSADDPGGIPAAGSYAADTWGALLLKLGYTQTATDPPTEPDTFYDNGLSNGCSQAITLQARSNYAGITYDFKNYLNLDDNDLFYNTSTGQFATQNLWTGYVSDAPVWPVAVETTGNSKSSLEVQDTAKDPGSIGFTIVADVENSKNGGFTNKPTVSTFDSSEGHEIAYAQLQNNVATVSKDVAEGITPPADSFADPLVAPETTTVGGNCETDKLLAGDKSPPYSYTDSWYGITAEDPNVGVDDTSANWYPLCGISYDLVWRHYNAGGLWASSVAGEIANSVKDLFTYITGAAGQTAVDADGYAGVPTPSLWKNHIALGVAAISG